MDGRYPLNPEVVDQVRRSLEAMLSEVTAQPPYNATASQQPVPQRTLRTSRATIPGIQQSYLPGGGAADVPFEAFRDPNPGPRAVVKDVYAAQMRNNIDRLLLDVGSLDLPQNLPDLPYDPTNPRIKPGPAKIPKPNPLVPMLRNVVRGLGPEAVISLLLTPTDLNSGEDERLKQYKADDLRSSGGPR